MLSTLALIYAELGATYPVAGGTARFAYFSHGPVAGFLSGWTSWLQAVFIAPVEIIASLTYLSSVHWVDKHFNMITKDGLLNGRGLIVAILAMVGFTALNLAGAKLMAESNTGIVIWKTLVPILAIVVVVVLAFHPGNFHTSSDHGGGGGFAPFGIHGIFAALPAGVVFALAGLRTGGPAGRRGQEPEEGHLARHPHRDGDRCRDLPAARSRLHRRAQADQPRPRLGEPARLDRRQQLRRLVHHRAGRGRDLAGHRPDHRRRHLPRRHRPGLPGYDRSHLLRHWRGGGDASGAGHHQLARRPGGVAHRRGRGRHPARSGRSRVGRPSSPSSRTRLR